MTFSFVLFTFFLFFLPYSTHLQYCLDRPAQEREREGDSEDTPGR